LHGTCFYCISAICLGVDMQIMVQLRASLSAMLQPVNRCRQKAVLQHGPVYRMEARLGLEIQSIQMKLFEHLGLH